MRSSFGQTGQRGGGSLDELLAMEDPQQLLRLVQQYRQENQQLHAALREQESRAQTAQRSLSSIQEQLDRALAQKRTVEFRATQLETDLERARDAINKAKETSKELATYKMRVTNLERKVKELTNEKDGEAKQTKAKRLSKAVAASASAPALSQSPSPSPSPEALSASSSTSSPHASHPDNLSAIASHPVGTSSWDDIEWEEPDDGREASEVQASRVDVPCRAENHDEEEEEEPRTEPQLASRESQPDAGQAIRPVQSQPQPQPSQTLQHPQGVPITDEERAKTTELLRLASLALSAKIAEAQRHQVALENEKKLTDQLHQRLRLAARALVEAKSRLPQTKQDVRWKNRIDGVLDAIAGNMPRNKMNKLSQRLIPKALRRRTNLKHLGLGAGAEGEEDDEDDAVQAEVDQQTSQYLISMHELRSNLSESSDPLESTVKLAFEKFDELVEEVTNPPSAAEEFAPEEYVQAESMRQQLNAAVLNIRRQFATLDHQTQTELGHRLDEGDALSISESEVFKHIAYSLSRTKGYVSLVDEVSSRGENTTSSNVHEMEPLDELALLVTLIMKGQTRASEPQSKHMEFSAEHSAEKTPHSSEYDLYYELHPSNISRVVQRVGAIIAAGIRTSEEVVAVILTSLLFSSVPAATTVLLIPRISKVAIMVDMLLVVLHELSPDKERVFMHILLDAVLLTLYVDKQESYKPPYLGEVHPLVERGMARFLQSSNAGAHQSLLVRLVTSVVFEVLRLADDRAVALSTILRILSAGCIPTHTHGDPDGPDYTSEYSEHEQVAIRTIIQLWPELVGPGRPARNLVVKSIESALANWASDEAVLACEPCIIDSTDAGSDKDLMEIIAQASILSILALFDAQGHVIIDHDSPREARGLRDVFTAFRRRIEEAPDAKRELARRHAICTATILSQLRTSQLGCMCMGTILEDALRALALFLRPEYVSAIMSVFCLKPLSQLLESPAQQLSPGLCLGIALPAVTLMPHTQLVAVYYSRSQRGSRGSGHSYPDVATWLSTLTGTPHALIASTMAALLCERAAFETQARIVESLTQLVPWSLVMSCDQMDTSSEQGELQRIGSKRSFRSLQEAQITHSEVERARSRFHELPQPWPAVFATLLRWWCTLQGTLSLSESGATTDVLWPVLCRTHLCGANCPSRQPDCHSSTIANVLNQACRYFGDIASDVQI